VAREHQVNGTLQRKTLWIYDGFLPLYEKETNSTGGDLTERVYVWSPTAHASGGASGLLWYRETTSTTTKIRSPLYDGRGNLVGLVDGATGQQISLYYYGPFGEPIGRRGEPANLGFVTHYTDPVSGLVDFGQRWYNPSTGHWLSREPLGEGESVNLYAYCNNDPVNYIDYLGLAELDSRCPSPEHIQAFIAYLEKDLEAIRPDIVQIPTMGSSYFSFDMNGDKKRKLQGEIAFWKDISKVHQLTGSDGYGYVNQKYKVALREVYGNHWLEKSDDYYHTFFMEDSPWMSDQKRAEFTAAQKSIASFSRFAETYLMVGTTAPTLIPAGNLVRATLGTGYRSFYSVQGKLDTMRLLSGGGVWPREINKSLLGEGFYVWQTRFQADAYKAMLEGRGYSGLRVIEVNILKSDYTKLKALDLRNLSAESYDLWMLQYSSIGKNLPHAYDLVIRETGNYGTEYFFAKRVFPLLKLLVEL
jgi:RHS repeat-associated protein